VSLAVICRSSEVTPFGYCESGTVSISGKPFAYAMVDPAPQPAALGDGLVLKFANSTCRSANLRVGVSSVTGGGPGAWANVFVKVSGGFFDEDIPVSDGQVVDSGTLNLGQRGFTVADSWDSGPAPIYYDGTFSCRTTNGL
jgi:hypothetical protein